MRDLVFLGLLPLMLYPMAKRPFVALGMWVWTAMFFPNAWLYGIASGFRYNLIFTGITVIGYLALKNKPPFVFGRIAALILLFLAWTTASTYMTIGDHDMAWEIWSRFFKVVLLFVFVVLIVEKKLHIDFILWCLVLSVGFFGCLEALKFILSGGGHMIAGFAGHVLGDRNELSIAFIMMLPLFVYLLQQYGPQSRLIKFGLLGVMALLVTAIIGTQSRGGFIALMGLGGYMFIKSDRKILLLVIVVILAGVLSQLVTDQWSSRMDTIGEAGADASFMGRVVAWKLSFIMAMNHPLFGGGFKSLENFTVWPVLAQEFFSYPFFYTGDALPDTTYPHAAHSVYFQVMGEHGFAGLAIYLSFLVSAFLKVRQVAKRAKKHVETAWIASLATMIQLSLFAFCLGGAALSFAYFELLYAFCGIILVLDKRILPADLARLAALPPAADAAPVATTTPALARR